MANWQHILDINNAWVKCEDDGDFKVLSKVIIDKLEKINFGADFSYERDGIIAAFQELINDENANINEFDSMMAELYDFGDTSLDGKLGGKKLMWVKTF